MLMNARLVQAVLAAAACGVAMCGVTALGANAASAQPTASVGQALGASHPLAAEDFSPENLRISNPGGARAAARISFVFGEQQQPGTGQPRWAAKLQRLDPATGSWVSVSLSDPYGAVH